MIGPDKITTFCPYPLKWVQYTVDYTLIDSSKLQMPALHHMLTLLFNNASSSQAPTWKSGIKKKYIQSLGTTATMANDGCLYSSILCYVVLLLLGFSPTMVVSTKDLQQWNILSPYRDRAKYSLKNYCESWRMNVELNNLRDFQVVPGECMFYISNYMTSTQYNVDQERAVEEALVHLTALQLAGDGKDAWIFDVDDTLLSTLPFFKQHSYGGEALDQHALESWMEEIKAPAVEAVLPLYNQLKMSGVKIIIITSRSERLRDVTAQNLVKAGFTGWTQLIMRGDSDNGKTGTSYKSGKREALVKDGYRILGNVGDQWSDVLGTKPGIRTFKLPNSMYYSA